MNPNIFNSVKLQKPRTSMFDLTHDVKTSFNMGELVPIMVTECVPGDYFRIGAESLIRFQPMVTPAMHRFDATIHYFFVPNRILWDGWEAFITGEGTAPAFPTLDIAMTDVDTQPLLNYMGIPNQMIAGGNTNEIVSALPFAAYLAIYNEYYRDQNLIADIDFKLANGVNSNVKFRTLRQRAWEHDYFTSALPTPQQGGVVDLPLGNVELDPAWAGTPLFQDQSTVTDATGTYGGRNPSGIQNSTRPGVKQAYDPDGSLVVNPTSINELRRAFRLQEFLERSMRGGKRYAEQILSHFGVKSPDARLQRPEYITGVKTPITISEVLNTSDTVNAPQGNMAGHGVTVMQGNYGKYRCQEHGYIIGVISVLPKTAYQQGIPRHFLKTNDRFDFYWPEFANLGEQAIQSAELFAFDASSKNTFGYTPRYAEYKFENNRVTGDMATSLNFWHAGRFFNSVPLLNQAFVEADPTTRFFAVDDPSVDHIVCQVLNKVTAIRPMPYHGTPMI